MISVATMTEDVSIAGGVRGTLTGAAGPAPCPCVVMLHGFGGHRNEVGGLFAKLAPRLSEHGIASLRIDFPGCGESAGDFADTTVGRYTEAALAALRFARGAAGVDPARIGLLGFSFGGAIATTCVEDHATHICALALWAPVGNPWADMVESIGAARCEEAARTGWTELAWGDRKIRLNRGFSASLSAASPLHAVEDFEGYLFVAAGSRDRLVRHVRLLCAAARRARSCEQRVIVGADHFFNALDPKSPAADALLADTVAFFAASLGG